MYSINEVEAGVFHQALLSLRSTLHFKRDQWCSFISGSPGIQIVFGVSPMRVSETNLYGFMYLLVFFLFKQNRKSSTLFRAWPIVHWYLKLLNSETEFMKVLSENILTGYCDSHHSRDRHFFFFFFFFFQEKSTPLRTESLIFKAVKLLNA